MLFIESVEDSLARIEELWGTASPEQCHLLLSVQMSRQGLIALGMAHTGFSKKL